MSMPGVQGTSGGFAPRSTPGRWAIALFVVFAIAMAVLMAIGSIGAGTWDPDFWANLQMTIPLLVAATSSLSSLVVGVVAIVQGDRSTSVTLVTAMAGMVTFFFVGELLSAIGVLPQH